MPEAGTSDTRVHSQEHGWELLRGGGVVRYGTEGVLAAAPPHIYLARGRYLRRYDCRSDTWEPNDTATPLPGRVGAGASMAYDGEHYLYLSLGGDSDIFCRFNTKASGLRKVARTPRGVGAGGRLAHGERCVFALRGRETYDFWCYETEENRWRRLGRLPDDTVPPVGYVSTGLVYAREVLYAFPDHRVLWWDGIARQWHRFARLGFRASCDGGMHALDESSEKVYIVQGMASRTLGVLDLRERRFRHVRPRLPDVVSVEGGRAVVVEVDDVRYLYVYRGHDTDEFWRIRVDALSEVGETG